MKFSPLRPDVLPASVSAVALWSPYLVYAASSNGYQILEPTPWLGLVNVVAWPVLIPVWALLSLIFENLPTTDLVDRVLSFVFFPAISKEPNWQVLVYATLSLSLLGAMTFLSRGAWWRCLTVALLGLLSQAGSIYYIVRVL